MNLTELQQEVYEITNRDDLDSQTKAAVKAATLKAHQTDFYSKDIFEGYFQFSNEAYIHSLDYMAIASNYRALKYIRKVEGAEDTPGAFLTVITPEELLDEFNRTRQDVCYVAGSNIEINSSTSFRKFLFACYVNPVVTDAGFSSWIANLHPYAIVHEAARQIFKQTAQDAESNAQKELVAEQYVLLKTNHISDVGY